jgi:hypothetical protein
MAATFTAQMSRSAVTGRWRLYVVLLDGQSQWPEHDLGRRAVIPTVQQRSRALNALGYVSTDDMQWQWTEDIARGDDPASPVRLIASITVREAGE